MRPDPIPAVEQISVVLGHLIRSFPRERESGDRLLDPHLRGDERRVLQFPHRAGYEEEYGQFA